MTASSGVSSTNKPSFNHGFRNNTAVCGSQRRLGSNRLSYIAPQGFGQCRQITPYLLDFRILASLGRQIKHHSSFAATDVIGKDRRGPSDKNVTKARLRQWNVAERVTDHVRNVDLFLTDSRHLTES